MLKNGDRLNWDLFRVGKPLNLRCGDGRKRLPVLSVPVFQHPVRNRPPDRTAQQRLIVISSLQEIDRLVSDAIYQAVFLSHTTRPAPGKHIFQRFRLSGTLGWISHDRLDQIEYSDRDTALGFHPKPEVLEEFRLKYGDAPKLSHHQASVFATRSLFPI